MLGAAGASVNQKVQKRAEFGVHISGYKVTGSSKKLSGRRWPEVVGGEPGLLVPMDGEGGHRFPSLSLSFATFTFIS